MGRLVLLRHGQTDFNVQHRFQGRVDISLNAEGVTQARAAASALVAGFRFGRIVASPLLRAVVTAQAVADLVDLPVETDERLVERGFGVLEGEVYTEMSQKYSRELDEYRRVGECAAAGIEPRREVGKRVAEAVRAAAVLAQANHGDNEDARGVDVLLVLHGAAISAGITALLGMDATDWHGIGGNDNCHWSVLEQGQRVPGWRLVAHNVGAQDTAR
ncbi:MAG: histidine phosphatase family protein [Actinomycetaceae bacterium]|nr:histidine phosphatase family protein [Actinomycetaceae bacterium]